MHDFRYHRPATLAAAADVFAASDDGRYVAGGQTLIPALQLRLDAPSDVIDLGAIPGLAGISAEGDTLTIGALTPHAEVAGAAVVHQLIPALADLAGAIGDPLVRNRGTMGGSLANNDPAADWPAAALGLGATIHTGARAITADEFFTGMFETALSEGEIITGVSFPVPETAGYARFPNPASRFPIAAVFTAKTANGVRVAVTGAGAGVFRLPEMEAALAGDYDARRLDGIAVDSSALNSDIHASAEYRAHLVGVMARRAVSGTP